MFWYKLHVQILTRSRISEAKSTSSSFHCLLRRKSAAIIPPSTHTHKHILQIKSSIFPSFSILSHFKNKTKKRILIVKINGENFELKKKHIDNNQMNWNSSRELFPLLVQPLQTSQLRNSRRNSRKPSVAPPSSSSSSYLKETIRSSQLLEVAKKKIIIMLTN